jgi:hypothetical protein
VAESALKPGDNSDAKLKLVGKVGFIQNPAIPMRAAENAAGF